MTYSVGATFLWRKPNQKSICQLCCPPKNPKTHEVKYTLSLWVKLMSLEQVPVLGTSGLWSTIIIINADNADNQNKTKTIELTQKEDKLVFVGSVELGSLDTGSKYIGRCVLSILVLHPLREDHISFVKQKFAQFV